MKRKLLAIAAVAVCLAVAVTGSVAYFTAEERSHNVITTGNIAIDLQEWHIMTIDEEGRKVPFPEEGVSGVMPGTQVSHIVEVKNTGGYDAFVRVEVAKTIALAAGVTGEPDLSLVTLDINTADWTEQGGYYYYNNILPPGATTEPLFTTVTFSVAMGNMYQNSVAKMSVKVQAVQAANNGTTALGAAGWPDS